MGGHQVSESKINELNVVICKNAMTLPVSNKDGVSVHFFKVGLRGDADVTAEELVALIKDSEEGNFARITVDRLKAGPSYIELGGWLGDQGAALMFMGLGEILGLWDVVTPETMLRGTVNQGKADELAGLGLVMIGWKEHPLWR
jgi:hypothetical protein